MIAPIDVVPINGWPGYVISLDGRVWRGDKEKTVYVAANGYKSVCISKANKSHVLTIHRLLALHFIGDPPSEKHEVCHVNGNRLDNSLANLRWGTRADNVRDAMRHGTAAVGARNGGAKLRPSDVPFMRDMRLLGFTAKEIAPHFGVSKVTVQRALTGETYKECQ